METKVVHPITQRAIISIILQIYNIRGINIERCNGTELLLKYDKNRGFPSRRLHHGCVKSKHDGSFSFHIKKQWYRDRRRSRVYHAATAVRGRPTAAASQFQRDCAVESGMVSLLRALHYD